MWTCVVLTCCSSRLAKALREELSILKEHKVIDPQIPCFVIEDPTGTIGSGGATLNALLVTVEKLCTIKGHSTVTSDVLVNANILIIHQGRNSCYWSSGKTFLPIQDERSDGSGLKTYLESVINLCSQLKENAPAGVWIASADVMLHGNLDCKFDWNNSSLPDALLVTLPCRKQDAEFCGVVQSNANGTVRAISYISNDEANSGEEEISIVAGIVYLKTEVAESVLSLSSLPELDSCTYIGSDNGGRPQQLSLYFDLLGPMCSDIEKSRFLSSDYGSSYDLIFGAPVDQVQREKLKSKLLIWEHLHTFKLATFSAKGLQHCYWTDRLPLDRILGKFYHVTSTMQPGKVLHSFAKYPKASLKCTDSTIEAHLNSENRKDLIVISSCIKSVENKTLNLRGKAFIISAHFNIDEVPEFYLGDNHCLVGYCIRTKENELKEGRAVFAASDIPLLDRNHPLATIFGMSWDCYLKLKGISPEDLWDSEYQSLSTAKLYPLTEDLTSWRNFLWLQNFSETLDSIHRLESWRISKRYSMADFIQLTDPVAALQQRRQMSSLSVCQSISEWQGSLIPYLQRACTEKWSEVLLEVLDRIAAKENRTKASRALATIADLLGLLAGPEGGLRSGPASNIEWLHAFHLLENVSVEEGVYALANQRAKWMDTPERLIRAARHYERAVHIMIRQVVQSVQAHMVDLNAVGNSSRPSMGHWVEVECPARIDLSGGWSDTPPICYEMGGSVVNMAILVNGKKPIGARGRRLEELQLVLCSEGQSEPLVITSLEDVMTYTNPTAPGALLKAALVCAGVVRKESSKNFSQQLLETLGGGLELHGWSLLPQGSGLGTSSILASALLAVIYTCMGIAFNRSQLIHAVLYIEQLLTTGGGWQDQVGGIMGGCNRGHSPADINVQVHVESLPVTDATSKNLNFLLVHTGKVRLARNLLQNVIRQWYARDETIVACFRSLIENAEKCRQALIQGDILALGHSIDTYWAQKRAIAPGSEPLFVRELMDRMAPHVYGQSLAGAGGGGFYFALLKENSDRKLIENVISSVKGADKMVIYSAELDQTGISMQINKHSAHIPA